MTNRFFERAFEQWDADNYDSYNSYEDCYNETLPQFLERKKYKKEALICAQKLDIKSLESWSDTQAIKRYEYNVDDFMDNFNDCSVDQQESILSFYYCLSTKLHNRVRAWREIEENLPRVYEVLYERIVNFATSFASNWHKDK